MADEEPQTANAVALGLAGFGITTVLLSLIKAGVLPSGGVSVVIPLALAYGGLIQLFAGVLEFRNANTFGTVAHLSYGGFWIWYALLLLMAHSGLVDISKSGSTIGVALILWGVFTFYLWIATFKLPRAVWFIFLTLWIAFVLLGIGSMESIGVITIIGGWVAFVCGASALYTSAALVANETYGSTIIPIGG